MWFWIVLAIVVGIGEMLTTGLFLGSVAVAALITGLAAQWLPIEGQMVVFAAAALGGLFLVRPLIIKALGWNPLSRAAGGLPPTHLEGKRGVVTQLVDDLQGQVRIGEGEFWTARAYHASEVIPIGTTIEVKSIDGFTARVSPLVVPAPSQSNPVLSTQKGDSL